jgi:uncharacterized integral membrane protein
MKTVKTLLYVVFAIVALIFGLLFSQANSIPITLKFYHYETLAMPLWFLVVVSALAGAVLTVLLVFFDLFKGSRKISRFKKENKSLQQEITAHKNECSTLRNQNEELTKNVQHLKDTQEVLKSEIKEGKEPKQEKTQAQNEESPEQNETKEESNEESSETTN